MAEKKTTGYRKEGAVLFVAVREPHLNVVIYPGGPLRMDNGDYVNSKPRFASFHPGPFGGEYSTKDGAVITKLRELAEVHRHHYVEVTSDEQLAELAKSRDAIVEDKEVVRRGAKTSGEQRRRFALEGSVPEGRAEALPAAARGPATDDF